MLADLNSHPFQPQHAKIARQGAHAKNAKAWDTRLYWPPINRREYRIMKNINSNKKKLTPERCQELLRGLKARFEKNMNRHKGLEWAKVQAKLEANAEKLWSLNEMERTGGEADVVGHDKKTGEYIFYDCSAESPKGRRSLCYDREA